MAQAQTVAIPKRWPLVSPLETRTSVLPLTKDARLINGYVEFDPADQEYWVWRRPGLGYQPVFGAGSTLQGMGLYTWVQPGSFSIPPTATNVIVLSAWAAAPNYSTFTLGYWTAQPLLSTTPTMTTIGTISSNSPFRPFFETVKSSPQTVVVGTNEAAYIINANGFPVTLTQITDPAFPTNQSPQLALVQGWVFLDGTLYVMDEAGNIWGSANLNSAVSWNVLNVISASANSDPGVALVKQLSYVVAMKTWSTQIFYDNGANNPPPASPLSPVPDAQLPWGCFSAGSVQSIDQTLIWMTSNQSVGPQIVRMDNLSASIVSTPSVDRILGQVGLLLGFPNYGITSTVVKLKGHRWYCLTLLSLNVTLVYDMDQPGKQWYIWTDASGNYWPITSMSYAPPSIQGTAKLPGLHLGQHLIDGYVFQVDADYIFPNDAGSAVPVDIFTQNVDFGVNRIKQLSRMYFNGDQVPGSALLTRFSDDDYQSWSDPVSIDLGIERPQLGDQGSFWRRAYWFRHVASTPFRVKSMDLQMDLGTG